jgi:sugar phosphate isomerase/epimerase
MPRPVTLFTGQWADLSLAELLPLVKKMGYDGVELACWGDHFEPDRALAEPGYVKKHWALLQKNDLTCFAISSHLIGQAVCDLIDERHKAILPGDVWGDGKPEGVRQRAAEKMKATAKAARKFFDAKPRGSDASSPNGGGGATATVNGFTGSSIFTRSRRRARIS